MELLERGTPEIDAQIARIEALISTTAAPLSRGPITPVSIDAGPIPAGGAIIF